MIDTPSDNFFFSNKCYQYGYCCIYMHRSHIIFHTYGFLKEIQIGNNLEFWNIYYTPNWMSKHLKPPKKLYMMSSRLQIILDQRCVNIIPWIFVCHFKLFWSLIPFVLLIHVVTTHKVELIILNEILYRGKLRHLFV